MILVYSLINAIPISSFSFPIPPFKQPHLLLPKTTPNPKKGVPSDGGDFDHKKAIGFLLTEGHLVHSVPLFNEDGTDVEHAMIDLIARWFLLPLSKQFNLFEFVMRDPKTDEEKAVNSGYKRKMTKTPKNNIRGGLCRAFLAMATFIGR